MLYFFKKLCYKWYYKFHPRIPLFLITILTNANLISYWFGLVTLTTHGHHRSRSKGSPLRHLRYSEKQSWQSWTNEEQAHKTSSTNYSFKLKSKRRASQSEPWEGLGAEWAESETTKGTGEMGSGTETCRTREALSLVTLHKGNSMYCSNEMKHLYEWPSTLLQIRHHLNGFPTHRIFEIVFENIGSGQRRWKNKEIRPFQICRSHLFPLFCVSSLVSAWLPAPESYDISGMQCWLLNGRERSRQLSAHESSTI